MHQDCERILCSEAELARTVEMLAARINRDYADKTVLVVGILKGAILFYADLVRRLTVDARFDFMAVSSYGASPHSTGAVRILKDLDHSIEGMHVLIVEDIVDSGLTMNYLLRNLRERKPASVEVCALMDKPSRRKAEVFVKYAGMEIPNAFVVGYGLDYAERYRNLPYIGVLKESVYQGKT